MNKLLLILAGVCGAFAPAAAQWRAVNSNTTEGIADMYFKNEDTGFCITTAGSVLQSINGGEDWRTRFQDTGLYTNQSIVAARDSVFCFGTGFLSSENGVSFSYKSAGYTTRAVPVAIQNPVAFNGRISTDQYTCGNGTYVPHAFPVGSAEGWLSYRDSTVIGAGDHTVALSKDYGQTWSVKTYRAPQLSSPPYQSYYGGDTLIAVSNYPNIIYTSYDGGVSWPSVINSGGWFYYFLNARRIIGISLFGPDTSIHTSTDGGRTFSAYVLPRPVSNAYFLDERAGFLFGDGGVIYKTTTGGIPNGIRPVPAGEPDIAIYPNPAGETVRLRLKDPNMSVYGIGLTDVSGRLLKHFPPVANVLSLSGLPAGVYFLRIATARGTAEQKIIKR